MIPKIYIAGLIFGLIALFIFSDNSDIVETIKIEDTFVSQLKDIDQIMNSFK